MDDLLADFLTETTESRSELDVALVRLEQAPNDAATLSLIFRLVHTIKGTCGFLGLPRLERVAHAGENVLGKLRDGVLTATPDVVTQVLAALDRIKLIIAGLAATETEPPGDDTALIAALDRTAAGEPSARKPATEATPPPSAPEPVADPVAVAEPVAEDIAEPAEEPALPPQAADAPVAEANPPSAAAPSDSGPAQQTIRVTVNVLEDLMTLSANWC